MAYTILAYHTIANYRQVLPAGVNTSVEDFKSHMDYLYRRGYQIIPLEKMVSHIVNGKTLGNNCLSITFDDGYEDHVLHAYPILKRYGFPATIFLTVKHINGYWESEKADGGKIKALSRDQILEMRNGGLIKFGSHGYSHTNFLCANRGEKEIEITESKTYLEDLLVEDVSFISYPFGTCDEETKDIVRKAGYKAGFSIWNRKPDIYSIPRIPLHSHDGMKRFCFKISPFYFPAKWIFRFVK
jgi:peptidoglycan/xylan/chitin deacetylase (PgdA/CDA1 family)